MPLQQLHAVRAARRSTVGLNGALWHEATSVSSGRGIGDMQRFPVEHELVLRLQVFTRCHRVAQLCKLDVTVSLRPAILHRCVWGKCTALFI